MIMFSKGELAALYKTNFTFRHNYGWSIEELENMTPYERIMYEHLLLEQLEKEKRANSKGM